MSMGVNYKGVVDGLETGSGTRFVVCKLHVPVLAKSIRLE